MSGLLVSATPRDCPLCRATSFDTVGTHDRDGHPLRTALCLGCGHVFTNPAPTETELNAYYSTKYRAEYKGVLTPKPKHVLRAGYRALERLERLRRFQAPPAKVLDVGAGGGEFAYLLSQAGYAVSGIEPNEGYAAYATQSYGLDLQATTLERAAFPDSSVDVITLHHVFEHVLEPRASLARFRQWLKHGGLLAIEVPNIMSWFHAPRRRFHAAHLHVFNQAGLEDLLRAAGFRIESTVVTPGPAHLNVIARKDDTVPATYVFQNNVAAVKTYFRRHTAFTHFISGMALKRLRGNALRPLRERRHLKALGNPATGREILDRLYQPHLNLQNARAMK